MTVVEFETWLLSELELCDGCGRETLDCSHDPCDDVIADRARLNDSS
jgi:hypothetical protein